MKIITSIVALSFILLGFTPIDRMNIQPDDRRDGKSIYVLSVPDASFSIVASVSLDLSNSAPYAEKVENAIAAANAQNHTFDAVMIRDGRTAHCIAFNDAQAVRSGKAVAYSNISILFQAKATANSQSAGTYTFDQTISEERTHAAMMTELMAFVKAQDVQFNAVHLDGKQKIELLQVAQ